MNNEKAFIAMKQNNRTINLIYPSIKPNSNIYPAKINKEIIPMSMKDMTYFSLSFRTSDAVLNAIALHYDSNNEYPLERENEDERFLIGPHNSQQVRKQIEKQCPYMSKAVDIIKKINEIHKKDIIGIYLLHLDESSANKQKFLVMTYQNVFLRDDSLTVKKYDYDELVLDENGLHIKANVESIGEPLLLGYMFDERFIKYFKDVVNLKYTVVDNRGERHPFSDCSTEYKNKYLQFLAKVALSEHRMSVQQILYLELLAREFQISANTLQIYFQSVLKKKPSCRSIQENLSELIKKYIPAEYIYVFYQDVLHMTINDDGEYNQENIVDILSKECYAGKAFVDLYLAAVKAESQKQNFLKNAIKNVRLKSLRLDSVYQLQRFYRDLNIKILKTGVDYNEYDKI